MNKTLASNKIPTPPAFMATTRQKILLRSHQAQSKLEHVNSNVSNSALDLLGSITKGIMSITKRA
ncbi:MAG: hypothetical protein NC200_00375 [Candidatus Gastranaerophilales bacterium]|nr:hypothetical protein [Candidatus Gastranaerophilales bacterium]